MIHKVAMRLICDASAGQFDPTILRAFQRCAPEFERIFDELAD